MVEANVKVAAEKRTSKLFVDEKIIMDMQPEEVHEYETVFKSIDKDKDGHIDASELLNVFHCLGYRDMKEADMIPIIKEVDLNNNQKIEYQEFILMMKNFKKLGIKDKFTKIMAKDGSTAYKVEGTGSYSTFSEEERTAYVKVINSVLAKDADCANLLPINPDSMDLFPVLKNGIILCKLINCAVPGTIDERVINKKENMNIFLITENLKLALSSAKSIGIKVIGIDSTIILEQRFALILGVIWQIVRLILLASVTIKKHPEIIKLLKEGEEVANLMKLPPEDILKRWFNYHLEKANYPKKLENFSDDLKDSEKYTILLNQLDPKKCDTSALQENDLIKRGQKVLDNAAKLGAHSYITPEDIKNGQEKLNLLFTAEIFNNFHGLEDLTKEEEEAYEKAGILDDDVAGTREERAFRMWINSLGIDDLYMNNLYEDVRSGVLLLKVIEKLKPGSVEWKNVKLEPRNNFDKVVNCNEAINACKRVPIAIVSTAGSDIHSSNRQLILGIVWQLMRESTLKILGNKKEKDILDWANSMHKLDPPMKGFDDQRFKNSLFLIEIMAVIEPRIVDWDIVKKDDESPEALQNNSKYAISIARKLGATIFCVWEDISEVKPKMLLTFTAALYEVNHLFSKLNTEKAKIGVQGELSTNVGLSD